MSDAIDFGVKLSDNKVSDWKDKYLDYSKLELLVKKAKIRNDECETLMRRHPEYASRVRTAYYEKTAEISNDKLLKSAEDAINKLINTARTTSSASTSSSFSSQQQQQQENDGSNEKTPLLSTTGRTSSTSSLDSISLLEFSELRNDDPNLQEYGKKLLKKLKAADEAITAFRSFLLEERNKVACFYFEKLSMIEKQLDVLVDNVQKSYGDNKEDAIINNIGGSIIFENEEEEKEQDGSYLSGTTRSLTRTQRRRYPSFHLEKRTSIRDQFTQMATYMYERNKHEQEVKRHKIRTGLHVYESIDEKELEDDDDLETTARSMISTATTKSTRTQQHDGGENHHLKEISSIKRALTDLRRTAALLQNYSMMNFLGFYNIIKLYNKMVNNAYRKISREDIIKPNINVDGKTAIVHGETAERLGNRIVTIYSDWFCEGNVREAEAHMLPKKGDPHVRIDWSQLRLCYRLGLCTVLAFWILWECIYGAFISGKHSSTIGARIAFPVFRGVGGLLLLHWFWGCSIYVWSRYRINYIYLFDFNPKIVNAPVTIFNECVNETLVYLVLMLFYYKAGEEEMHMKIPHGFFPFVLFLYTIKCLIFPWEIRRPLWKAIREVLMSPFGQSPRFFHTYVADVFTSMVKVFQDILFTLCYIFSGDFWLVDNSDFKPTSAYNPWKKMVWYKNIVIPLICLFPLLIRFNQNIRKYVDTGKRMPSLANALKYGMSQCVTLFGAFHPLILGDVKQNIFQMFWLALFVSSSLYSYFWDVYMDWDLGRPKYGMLGPRLMFPNKYHYYFVIVADLFLRFMWMQSLIPPNSGAHFELPAYLTAVNMAIELMRRTLWSWFRLEKEHRSNSGGFDTEFVPLHFSTGHDHRYKEKKTVGWQVLFEVLAIFTCLLLVSFFAIAEAQRLNERHNQEL